MAWALRLTAHDLPSRQQIAADTESLARPIRSHRSADLAFDFHQPVCFGRDPLRPVDRPLGITRAAEDSVERVEVLGGDRIEFVVMTARAGDGHGLERFCKSVDLVIDELRLMLSDIHGRMRLLGKPIKNRADDRFVEPLRWIQARVREEIAGHLFSDELVVRQVGVERADQVIAVPPGVRDRIIAFVTEGLGVAHQVQPMTGPAFAEPWRGEQTIHDLGESILGIVLAKCLHFPGRRREPGDVEGGAADQRSFVRRRSGRDALRFQPGENEMVDRAGRPSRVPDRRRSLSPDRFPAPLFSPALLQVERLLGACDFPACAFRGPGRALFDPRNEIVDLLGGQLPFGRHPQILVLVTDGRNEETFIGIAWDDGGARVAPFEKTFAGIEVEAALELDALGAMTFVAPLHQDRPDLFLEELDALR